MFRAVYNFGGVNRAALFAARRTVSAAVSSTDGDIRGVSDPVCHAPFFAPWSRWSGSLTPQMHITVVRQDRTLSLPSSSVPPASEAVFTSYASIACASIERIEARRKKLIEMVMEGVAR
jgi:hypothetical protein